MKLFLPLGVLLSAAALDRPARAEPLQIAIVVGSNTSPSPDLEPLRYADDDAIENARTLSLLGVSTTLLAAPDQETRELSPGERLDGPPTRARLLRAFDEAVGRLGVAKAAGRETTLFLLFAGHGDLDEQRRPYLDLQDGKLYRDDLVALLRRSPADINHVILDACQASQFVGERGPGGERASVEPGFSTGVAAFPPGTGLFVSRSSGGQAHEWAELQAGVFSYEVRSGLLGAADANLDGRITYRELAAFVDRANQAIPNRKYRPQVVAAPPGGNPDAVIATLPAGPRDIRFGPRAAGRYFLESERGIRLADLHAAPGQGVRLLLPADLGVVFVERVGESAAEYRIDPGERRVALADLRPAPPRARARGAAHEAFRLLFALPFGSAVVDGFRLDGEARSGADVAAAASSRAHAHGRLPWLLVAGGAAALAGGTAVILSGHALVAAGPDGVSQKALGDAIDRRNLVGGGLGAAGAAAALTGVAILWWQGRF